jgi:acyl-CoA reductase-like NAD-dependent aldehyde dehydrogenase
MGSRVLVHESVYHEFVTKMALKTSALRIGDPQDISTQIGPVITRESLERIHEHVKNAISDGAELVCGGMPLEGQGYYYLPTILGNVTREMRIFKEEVFGPVVAITKFSTIQEAVELANDSEFGLGASIWTRDMATAHKMANQVDAGVVWINGHHHNDPSSPWGGLKNSGMGRENGIEAFNAYTQPKSIMFNYGAKSDWFGDKSARYG